MKRSTRMPVYGDLLDPVKISIPIGCIVLFRGDHVHGGTSYDKKHTRLFMGMHLVNDGNAVNTTCLQEEEKLTPCDIKGESTTGDGKGNRSHRKRASEATRKYPQKEGNGIGIDLHDEFVTNAFCSNTSHILIYYIPNPLHITRRMHSIIDCM